MRISINISEAEKTKFSAIKLVYTNFDGIESTVDLIIHEFSQAYDYTNRDLRSVKFDFFLISSIIYGIDNLLDREKYSVDGWAREIEVEIPVYNPDVFNRNGNLLEEALCFLTGDYWSIQFTENTVRRIFKRKERRRSNIVRYQRDKVKEISLFSGGLDSLIGVIDTLENLQSDDKMLLVSHFDFMSSGTNKAQTDVFNKLDSKYSNKSYWIQTKVALSRKDNFQNTIKVDSNYRSRSLLFIGLGTYLSNANQLIIPENGTISINYPLTPSRSSSLSTRTTHPYVIAKLQEFISAIGIEILLINPYSFKTKGEMVIECLAKTTALNDIYLDSISCGKSGHNRSWENRSAKQCGVCMPCIYRRAALNKAGLDNETYGKDIVLNSVSYDYSTDMKALFSYLKRNISKEQMKTDLVINGSIKADELENYAELVLRSKEEVLKLFRDKGNTFVKRELGLI